MQVGVSGRQAILKLGESVGDLQVPGGKSAAGGARNWCTVLPAETPTVPGRRLTMGLASHPCSHCQSAR